MGPSHGGREEGVAECQDLHHCSLNILPVLIKMTDVPDGLVSLPLVVQYTHW